MARHKNEDWILPENCSWDLVTAAVLMDLRDELQQLNRLLHCTHFVAVPTTLRTIARNTTKRKRKGAR